MTEDKKTTFTLTKDEIKEGIRLWLLQRGTVFPELGIDNPRAEDIKLTGWEDDDEPEDGLKLSAEWTKIENTKEY